MDHSFLLVSGLALVGVGLLALASHAAGVPPIVSYMLLGLAGGSLVVGQAAALAAVADIGIVLLFFFLGLQFPLSKMMGVARRVGAAGLLDLVLNFGGVAGLAMLLGVEPALALILGGVAYASSSSITLALLGEKRRMANPETEFILALLIFEDLVAPVMVALLAALARGEATSLESIGRVVASSVALVLLAVVLARYGFARLGGFIERHTEQDFMVLLSVGFGMAFGGVAVLLGLSEVLGAFLAGIMLAESGRTATLDRLVTPVRNITLPFFFVYFGTSIGLGGDLPSVWLLVALVGYATLAKLVVGAVGGVWYGLRPRVAWRAGFSLIQRGEFSAVIAALAPAGYRAFGGLFIITTAILGAISFIAAPKLAAVLAARVPLERRLRRRDAATGEWPGAQPGPKSS